MHARPANVKRVQFARIFRRPPATPSGIPAASRQAIARHLDLWHELLDALEQLAADGHDAQVEDFAAYLALHRQLRRCGIAFDAQHVADVEQLAHALGCHADASDDPAEDDDPLELDGRRDAATPPAEDRALFLLAMNDRGRMNDALRLALAGEVVPRA